MILRRHCRFAILAACLFVGPAQCETLQQPATLEQQLKAADAGYLAEQARRRGDPQRGALVFYKSAAACVNCHGVGDDATPLGPDLATLGKVTDVHVIESLLHPSKSIAKVFRHSRCSRSAEMCWSV